MSFVSCSSSVFSHPGLFVSIMIFLLVGWVWGGGGVGAK